MEEFDQRIKYKIESLTKVPGVKFNEKKVWARINNHFRENLSLGLGTFLVLLLSIIILFQKKNVKLIGKDKAKAPVSTTLVDTIDHSLNESVLSLKDTVERKELTTPIEKNQLDLKVKLLETSINQLPTIHPIETSAKEKITYAAFQTQSKAKQREKEIYYALEKEYQTVGFTHLKALSNQLFFSFGVEFSRRWKSSFYSSELVSKPQEFHQIRIPIGIRYNFNKKESKLNSYLYLGLSNSFLFKGNPDINDFTMGIESDLGIDYRIFSTKYGQKAFLRFKLPLYRKNLIHRGTYQPNLYDVLKK